MIRTEEEARDCWCPFARIPATFTDGIVAVNRDGDNVHGYSEPRCIASGCMAWRKAGQIGLGPKGERREVDLDGRTRWLDQGYCGLAGKP